MVWMLRMLVVVKEVKDSNSGTVFLATPIHYDFLLHFASGRFSQSTGRPSIFPFSFSRKCKFCFNSFFFLIFPFMNKKFIGKL